MRDFYEDLLIKTFVADSIGEIDRLCNDFRKGNVIRATQSNSVYDFHQKKIFFIYTLFYLPKANVPQPEAVVQKPSPEKIEEKVARLPKIIVDESEALWTNCLVCKGRWKWTHYRLCQNRHGIEGLPAELHARYKEIWNGDGTNGDKLDNPIR